MRKPKRVSSVAKITRPRISGIVPRTRLFDFFDSGKNKPITWISGPAGSGKTTLVASYLDSRGLPCLWYQMDEGDSDIATFFYYMGLAAKCTAPRSRKPLPLLTPEYLQGIRTFSRRYFENLYLRSKPPFVIVFDNYQNAPPDSGLHEVIGEGLSVVPDGLHIILVSRSTQPPEFTRLRANSRMNFVGWEDLKFTPDETRAFVTNKRQEEIADGILKRLYDMTEGWAAGLVLLLEGLENRVVAGAAPERLKLEDVFNYFAKEIFEKCHADIQDFLIETSFLPKMTPGMADALAGKARAQEILSELNRKNYFTQRQATEAEVYQYHPLFREFLQGRAQESLSVKRIAHIKRSAAAILEDNGYVENAIELFCDAGEWNEAARLILAQAPLIVAQGRGQSFEHWIRRLPESICEQNPFLYYWLGMSLMAYNPRESLRHLESAFHIFRRKKDPTGTFLAFSDSVVSIVHCLDSFKPLDRWISMLYKLRAEYKCFPSDEIEARVTMSVLLMFCFRPPPHLDFEWWAERARALLQTIKDNMTKVQILDALIYYRLLSGELSKAALFINSFREATQSLDVTPMVLLGLKDLEVFYFWLTANFAGCSKVATEGLELAASKGVHIFDYFIAGHGASGALSEGDLEAAEGFLRKMEPCLDRPEKYPKNLYHDLMTWKALLQGDLPQALLHAESGVRVSSEAGAPQTGSVCHLGMAIVMHELKRDKEVSTHINEIHKISGSTDIRQVEFRCLLAEARFALDRGNKDSMRILLKKALALGRERVYLNAYFWLPSIMAKLCMEALNAGIEVEYVQNLVRIRNLVPDTPPFECENWPWPFRIHTFGRFELTKDEKPVDIPQRPLSLLKVLVSFGGREVSREQLEYELWPDSEGDAAHTALEVTLHRLRRLIGSEKAVQFRAGNVSMDSRFFWVDIWALEHIYGKIASCLGKGEGPKGRQYRRRETEGRMNEVVRLTDKAVDIYQGHFLPTDTSCSWTLAPRERWRSKFLHLVLKTGTYLEELEKYEKAAGYYQKGLEVDCLAEEFYQRLMVCFQKLDRKAEALAVYNRCRDALSKNLSVNPSSVTQAIHASLRQRQEEPDVFRR